MGQSTERVARADDRGGLGVFFSAQRFPDAAQPLIGALPVTALNDGLRAIMLQGAGPDRFVLGFVAALRLFRWR